MMMMTAAMAESQRRTHQPMAKGAVSEHSSLAHSQMAKYPCRNTASVPKKTPLYSLGKAQQQKNINS